VQNSKATPHFSDDELEKILSYIQLNAELENLSQLLNPLAMYQFF